MESRLATSPDASRRSASLDQFRGYTVAGMLLVNFVGGYAAVPAILKHHNTYCSYADTIMPQFFFAVGFAFRMTYLRRLERDGASAAWSHAAWRNLGLLALGIVFHGVDGRVQTWAELTALGPWGVVEQAFRREPFQTLTHIALSSFWCLPVIGAESWVRWCFLAISALLHLGLSASGWFAVASGRPVIDGGALGFLSWSIPVLLGSLTFDATRREGARAWVWSIVAAIAMMSLGVALSRIGGPTPPPFFPPDRPLDLWMMSQRTGSISYQLFAAGFALAVHRLFTALADSAGWTLGIFRTFGTTALATYLVHGMVFRVFKSYTPKDAPEWFVAISFVAAFTVVYRFARHLEREGGVIRL
ncbi:MAG: hypothetical protein SFX72_04240 [Isosphaeraceae bacterium]|nr:hypothetical protein [Isosphaeraceae bacterium]